MEKGILVGIVLGIVLIFGSIFAGGDYGPFGDVPSIVLVLGGTTSGLLAAFSFSELKQFAAGAKSMLFFAEPDNRTVITQFVELATIARREGLLALDRKVREIENDLIRMGLEMAVDGVESSEITEMMRIRMDGDIRDMAVVPKFWNTAATFAPAFGMIGTLIGLVQMMQNLTDPSAIGAGMAVAMITTFYGAFFANLIFLPLATKSKSQIGVVLQSKELIIAGVQSIVNGDSPTVIQQRLALYVKEGSDAKDGDNVVPLSQAA